MANPHEIDDRYRSGDYLSKTGNWHDDDAAWKARHVLAILRRNQVRFATIADVGCGTGGVLVSLARQLGDETVFTGFEIAPEAFEVAATRAGECLSFRNQSIFEASEVFDIVLAMDVFEHVSDYLGFLASLRAQGRQFVFHIPLDISVRTLLTGWPMEARRSVGHLHYFTEETAAATLETAGYEIIDSYLTHAIMQPPPTLLSMRIRRLPHRLLYWLSPHLCAKLLGGCSLLVFAR